MDPTLGHVNLLGTLRPFFQEMGRQRLTLRRHLILLVGAGAVLTGLLAVYTGTNARRAKLRRVVSPVPLFLTVFVARRSTKRYVESYKSRVFSAATSATYPTLRYESTGCMPASVYAHCDLFDRRPDLFHGQDLFVGTINGVKVAFSEIRTEAKVRYPNGKVRDVPLFNGVLFQAEFNKQLQHVTTLVPATHFNAAYLARPFMGVKRDRQPVANGEFEKLFHVYGSNAEETQAVFTSAFMDRMMAVVMQFERRQLRASFIGNRLTIAAAYGKGRFHPGLWTGGGDMDNMHFFIQQVFGFATVVEMLKKSKQFWTVTPRIGIAG